MEVNFTVHTVERVCYAIFRRKGNVFFTPHTIYFAGALHPLNYLWHYILKNMTHFTT